MDEFERDYNFRFEEPGGTELVSHPRKVDSARITEPSRRREKDKPKGTFLEQ
jgi:protein KRI1